MERVGILLAIAVAALLAAHFATDEGTLSGEAPLADTEARDVVEVERESRVAPTLRPAPRAPPAPEEVVDPLPGSEGLPWRAIVVEDFAGNRLPGARVRLRTASDKRLVVSRHADAQGFVTFRGPGAGAFHLEITPPRRARYLQPLVRVDYRPGAETLRLGSGLRTRGTVKDAHGAGVARASVIAEDHKGVRRVVATERGGTFALPDLHPGPVTLDVVRRIAGNPVRASAVVRAGQKDVVLTLENTSAVRIDIEGLQAKALQPQSGDPWVGARRVPKAMLLRRGQPRSRQQELEVDVRAGRIRSGPLPQDARYDVWMHVPTQGAYLLVEDVAPGKTVRREPLTPGATIRGSVDARDVGGLPNWHQQVVVRARQGRLLAEARLEASGQDGPTFELRGLPPGSWTVTLEVPRQRGEWLALTPMRAVAPGDALRFTLSGTWDVVRGNWTLKAK